MAIANAESIGIRYQGVLATTGVTTVATVPSGKVYSGLKISFSNNSGSTSCNASVYLIPSGQAAANTYRVLPPTLVPAGVVMEYACPHELPSGYFVQVLVDVANLLTCMSSARELS